uniref:Uncharacterized protein n=1 Tax=Triticum urartu TaxID=4572 RepID=A0A8R7QH20_TRIUA
MDHSWLGARRGKYPKPFASVGARMIGTSHSTMVLYLKCPCFLYCPHNSFVARIG